MRKSVSSKKKIGVLFLASLLAASTATVAISCGESSESAPKTYRDKFEAAFKNLKFDPSSNHKGVRAIPPDVDPIAKSYEYLTGNYTTLEEVKKYATSSDWKPSLPTEVNAVHNNRNIWVRVNLKTETELSNTGFGNAELNEFTGDKQYFNITSSSNIRKIRTLIDDSTPYKSVSLSGIKVSGNLDAPVISNSDLTLPDTVEVRYELNDKIYTKDEITNYIKNNKSSPTITAEAANIHAILITNDPAKYTINDNKDVQIGSDIPVAKNSQNLVAALRGLRPYRSTSINNGYIYWGTLLVVTAATPSNDVKIQYYLGDVDAAGIEANTIQWVSTLPNSADYEHAKRSLYAKITTTNNGETSQNIVDLTTTSRIRSVKSVIDYAPGYSSLQLSKITLKGPLSAAEIVVDNTFKVPNGAAVRFRMAGEWLSDNEFVRYVKANSHALSASDITAAKIKFAPSDEALYVIFNSKETTVSYMPQ